MNRFTNNRDENKMHQLSRMQTAIVLDELPKNVLAQVEQNKSDVYKLSEILSDVDLSGYFDKITDKNQQTNFVANHIFEFFKQRSAKQ